MRRGRAFRRLKDPRLTCCTPPVGVVIWNLGDSTSGGGQQFAAWPAACCLMEKVGQEGHAQQMAGLGTGRSEASSSNPYRVGQLKIAGESTLVLE
jgi:hypothetical protein